MKKKWRARNDLVIGQYYGQERFTSDMANFKGKEVTVKHVRIHEDSYEWNWTPEMFEDELASDCPFKRGDEVEVSPYYERNAWRKRIFVAYVPGADNPYMCVLDRDEGKFKRGEPFGIMEWKHCRPCRPDLKEGDPVIVWDEEGLEARRFFAEWAANGKIRCFRDGGTKWTSKGDTITWNHWRLPTKEELEK